MKAQRTVFSSLLLVTLLLFMGYVQAEVKCEDESLCVYTERVEDEVILTAWNKEAFDITVKFDFELSNMQFKGPEQSQYVVASKSRNELLRLIISDRYQRSGYNYNSSWVPGNMNAEHDDSALYQLPYKVGSTFYVSQSCDGKLSHRENHSRNAIDFAMPEGTKVYAARGGTVVDLHEVSISGGISSMHLDEANFVKLQHPDGTIASYSHLRTMGVKVEIGDEVSTGDLLGISGNTGFSNGPHLHFSVQRAASAENTVSIPVNWKTARGILSCPRRGKALKAVALDT